MANYSEIWTLDTNVSNNTDSTGVQYSAGNNTFYNFGTGSQSFAILINASRVIFDGMGATLNGQGKTDYGIIVNNQTASNYNLFSSDSSNGLYGVSITNVTLTGFRIAGIFFNNVLGDSLGIECNLTNVHADNNPGSGMVSPEFS